MKDFAHLSSMTRLLSCVAGPTLILLSKPYIWLASAWRRSCKLLYQVDIGWGAYRVLVHVGDSVSVLFRPANQPLRRSLSPCMLQLDVTPMSYIPKIDDYQSRISYPIRGKEWLSYERNVWQIQISFRSHISVCPISNSTAHSENEPEQPLLDKCCLASDHVH